MKTRNVVIALTIAAMSFTSAAVTHYTFGPRVQEIRQQAEQRAATEDRILAWIVERNPDAKIRDFAGFSRVLLAEAQTAGLDWRLLLAIADKESQMRPDAVSPKGAVGLFQIMPATAEIIARNVGWTYTPPVKGNLGTLGEPKANLRFAIRYFQDQVLAFGLNEKSLQAYNRGPAKARQHWPGDSYAKDILARAYLLTLHFER